MPIGTNNLEVETYRNKLDNEVSNTVKLGDKEQIGVKEPFPVTNLPVYFIMIRNNFRVTKEFLITKFDCN